MRFLFILATALPLSLGCEPQQEVKFERDPKQVAQKIVEKTWTEFLDSKEVDVPDAPKPGDVCPNCRGSGRSGDGLSLCVPCYGSGVVPGERVGLDERVEELEEGVGELQIGFSEISTQVATMLSGYDPNPETSESSTSVRPDRNTSIAAAGILGVQKVKGRAVQMFYRDGCGYCVTWKAKEKEKFVDDGFEILKPVKLRSGMVPQFQITENGVTRKYEGYISFDKYRRQVQKNDMDNDSSGSSESGD